MTAPDERVSVSVQVRGLPQLDLTAVTKPLFVVAGLADVVLRQLGEAVGRTQAAAAATRATLQAGSRDVEDSASTID